jgi:hypothetical protein
MPPKKQTQQWVKKSKQTNTLGNWKREARLGAVPRNIGGGLFGVWSTFNTYKFTTDAGLGATAYIPVRTLTDVTPWNFAAGDKTSYNTKYEAAEDTGNLNNNKNQVPVAWEFQIESISTSTTGACREGGISIGFFNRNAEILAAAAAAPATQAVGFPDPTTISWKDVGFTTPRAPIGALKVYKVNQPPWGNGWTLEDCHANGKAFIIRWTSSTPLEFNISIRYQYQVATAI